MESDSTVETLVNVVVPMPTNPALPAAAVLNYAHALEVLTADAYAAAAEWLLTLKARRAAIDAERKNLVKPIDEALSRVQDLFRQPLEMFDAAERVVKGKLVSFLDEQERIRREEQRKIDEAAAKERARLEKLAEKAEAAGKDEKAQHFEQRAAQVVAPVVRREAPTVAGISTREVWKFEVTDPQQVPREFLMVDETKLRKYVAAMKGDTKVAGVRVWPDKSIAGRA